MKLYEISAEYTAFLEAIDNGDIPDEAIADTLESLQAAFEDKADSIACVIKNMTAEVNAIAAEKKILAERQKRKEKRIEWLKAYLTKAFQTNGCTELETARNKITFRKSEKVAFDNEADFIMWCYGNNPDFLKFSSPEIDRTAVKKAISEGAEIRGAHIENNQNIQIK